MTRAALAMFLAAGIAPADDALPRYKLTPGQEITYRTVSTSKTVGDKGPMETTFTTDWTGRVTQSNPDGGARVVFREVFSISRTYDGKAPPKRQTVDAWAYADIAPDGRIAPNPTIRHYHRPDAYFPPLPADAAQAQGKWEQSNGDDRLALEAVPGEGVLFALERHNVFSKIYGQKERTTYTFDPSRGIVAGATCASEWSGHSNPEKREGKIELVSVQSVTGDELSKLAADADRYFAATAAYDEATRPAVKAGPAKCKEILDAAIARLKAAAAELTHPELKAALEESTKQNEQYVKNSVEVAERRAKVVGQPAFDAKAEGMDGKPVKLADFKGKVVVLDFWYRGCGWCVKAMPQINQLVGDFAGETVAVIGMNTDRDKADAEFVIREMGLKYSTVRIEHDVSDKFGVQGFPTLVLLDKAGNVRDLHVGYSDTLREDVGKAIRELLAEK